MNGTWLALGAVGLGVAVASARGSRARKTPEWGTEDAFGRAPDVTRYDEWIWWGPADDPYEAESFTVVERTWRGFRVTRYDVLPSDEPPRPRMRAITGEWRAQLDDGRWVPEKEAPPPPDTWVSISTSVEEDDLAPGRRLGPRVAAGVGSVKLSTMGGTEETGDDDLRPHISLAERESAMRRMTALRQRTRGRRP
jgi:hypothetical protein